MQPLYEYVCHMKGHRSSDGELAEWVIKSHETGEILSSHKSEKKAKEHLQHMHIFGESVEGEAACSHCGWSADGVEEYNGRLLCPYCLTQFKWLDEHRDPENGMYEKYDLVPRESESDKLLGESTYGTDMDKRVQIFMEGVSQLGLSKNQVDAIGKITNACMEGIEDGDFGGADFGAADFGAPPDLGGPSPARDAMEEYQLDQVYNELWKLGVPTDTINARGRQYDFSFKTMYKLLKEVCNWKGVPVPEIMGVEDYKTSVSDLGGDGEEEEITNACMEGVGMDGEPKDGPDSTDKFVIDAFYRAVSRLLVKYPNRLSEDEVAGVISDKRTGKKFSIDFDPRCHMIEVRTNGDRKTYPLWVNKSKSINLLIELIMDIFSEELENTDSTPSDYDIASELYPDDAPTYGRHVRTSEDEYDPENPGDPDDDMFYGGNGRVNELDPDEEPAEY